MNAEYPNTDVPSNINTGTSSKAQDFRNIDNHLVNIDDLLSNSNSNSIQSSQTNNNQNTEYQNTNDGLRKLKIIGAGAGILLLTVVSGALVYMMYPIEFNDIGKTIQGNVTASQTGLYTNTGSNIDNKNILTQANLDSGSKNQIDDLFAGKGLSGDENLGINNTNTINTNNINNNTPPLVIDDPNKLNQNPDGSPGLTQDSSILEGLNTGANYGNGNEEAKIKLLSQIRAKIEIAKINYGDAKKSQNIESMKLIASSLAKYKKLLTQVENNELTVTNEVQDKMVEIQADMDKAKILIQ